MRSWRLSSTLKFPVAALFLGATLLAAPWMAPAARAAGPRPMLTVLLHFDFLRVKTTATAPPTVRVTSPQGELKAAGRADQATLANGEWTIPLTAPGDLGRREPVRPGDTVAVTADGQQVTLVAPSFTAAGDVATDVVRGKAPPWATAAVVIMFSDPMWNPGASNLPLTPVVMAAGGAFEANLAGKFDIAPGTWGYAGAFDAEGNVIILPFAPPTVWMLPSIYAAYVQTDPSSAPVLAAVSPEGLEHFRSPAGALLQNYPAPRFLVSFADPDHPELPFDLEAGYTLKLYQDGREVLAAKVPWLGTSVDRQKRLVSGLAPAGSRAYVTLYPEGTQAGANAPSVTQSIVVGASEALTAGFPGASISPQAIAVIVAYPSDGTSVAFGAAGLVASQQLLFYGYQLAATFAGWGEVQVEHRSGGKVVAARRVRSDALGRLVALVNMPVGGYTTFAPGDEIRLTPERGDPLLLTIPRITAEVSDDRKTLQGAAPPGMALAAKVFDRDPFGAEVLPFEGPNVPLSGAGDATGRYRLVCGADPKCLMRYGLLTAYDGAAEYVLQWLERPFVIVGVTLSSALARATVGTDVILTAIGRDGRPGTERHDLVRPQGPLSLPFWETGLTDLYPGGLQPGDRLRVEMGSRTFEVRVPDGFTWQADTLTNRVSGTGPAGAGVITQANPRNDPSRSPGSASAIIGLDGRWRTVFQGYDLRAGDDLYLLLPFPAQGYILYWLEESVQGPEPAATPAPTETPAPAATPTSTGGQPGRRVFLPYGMRR